MNLFSYQVFYSTFLLFVTQAANAVNVNYSIEGGVGYSDNITRDATTPLKDSVRFVGGRLNVTDESSTNDFNLDMDINYRDYRDNVYDDEVITNLSLLSNFSIIDDSLTWALDGYVGQQAISPFTVTTPDNLQNTRYVSTGPDLVFRFTNVDSFTLGYRYNDFYTERTRDDYQSNNFRAVLARRLNPLHTISFNIDHENLTYDDSLNSDFKSLQHTIAFNGSSTTNQYGLEWGVIDIEFEDGAEGDNNVYRAFFSRAINSYNSISIQLSETVENGARAATGTIPGVVTTGLFINDLAQLSYTYSRGDFQVDFSSTYSDQDFIDPTTSDQKILSNLLSFTYGSIFNLQTRLSYSHLTRDFYNDGLVNEDDTITLSLEKRITRNLNIVGTYVNYTRDSNDTPNLTIEENRVIVTLRYLGRI